MIFTPPWLCYVATVQLTSGKIGIFKSVGLGILVYIALSALLQRVLFGAKL